ncbi:putative endoglucanase precursor, partial [Basidiobolus meristosporus CBS 931.73]
IALGHMQMIQPPPRESQYNPTYKGTPDYDMASPLDPGRWPYPCRGYGRGGIVQTVKAGSKLPVKISGGAPHNGGHCQFALSYDDNTFVVLKDVFDDCLIASLDFSIQIPAGAPSGRATLAWAWINKTGNREYYMNCADIEVQGTASGSVTGPKLLVVNLPGYATIPE